MAIRYDKKLNQEINKTIRNFNQKISRLEKSQRDLILPNKITKKELKENSYNRTELKRKLKELQRYSKRGIEETTTTLGGVKLSKYELDKLSREAKRVKASLTREINKMKTDTPKVFGKKQATTFAQMGDQHYLNLKTRRLAIGKVNIKTASLEQLDSLKKLIDKTLNYKRYYNNIFKDNYLKMVTDLGYYCGYDGSKLENLKNKIRKLDSNKFLSLFRNEKSIQAILEYYPDAVANPTDRVLNPEDIKEDVTVLYDALVNNIDDILKDYK